AISGLKELVRTHTGRSLKELPATGKKDSARSGRQDDRGSIIEFSKMVLRRSQAPNCYAIPSEDFLKSRLVHVHVPAKRDLEGRSFRNVDEVQRLAWIVANQQRAGAIVYLEHLTRDCEILAGRSHAGRGAE